ncbi:MAG: short-chain fatty acyl-CoA regulator family protein [Pseudomonadota bacterium]
MQKRTLTGTRLREYRLRQGVKQGELATRVGISASYLNLIEHNKRKIGGRVLSALAGELDVEPSVLSQGAEVEMLAVLQDIALAQNAPEDLTNDIEDLATRFPDWAVQLVSQHRRISELERVVGGLNDRLTHDPVLSEKMHEVLAAVSAIRATASILIDEPQIDAEWRNRFHGNIDAESRRLADTSATMAQHFDQLGRRAEGFLTDPEELAAFLDGHQFHFPTVEDDGHFAIKDLIAGSEHLTRDGSRGLATAWLERYCTECASMPLGAFRTAALECDFDPGALAQQFDVGIHAVFRRLASLPEGPDIPQIGLVTCDGAGAFMTRKPLRGFSLPRFGAGCALWPLYEALMRPGQALRRLLRSEDGRLFAGYALAENRTKARFDDPPILVSSMLMIETSVTDHATDERSRRVGSSCRVCARHHCTARREPSILQAVTSE